MRQVTRLGAKPPGAALGRMAFDRRMGTALSKGDHGQGWERLKQAHFNLGHLPSLSIIPPQRLWGPPPHCSPQRTCSSNFKLHLLNPAVHT